MRRLNFLTKLNKLKKQTGFDSYCNIMEIWRSNLRKKHQFYSKGTNCAKLLNLMHRLSVC